MSVFKRGKVCWYEFVFHGARIRESAHTSSKTIARLAEQERRRKLEPGINGLLKRERHPLFRLAAERWLDEKRARLAHNTGELYRFALKPLIAEFGDRLACDIRGDDITAYQITRLKKGFAPRTVNVEVATLRSILKAHRLWAGIADGVEMLRERKDVGRAITRQEEEKLLDAIHCSRSPALLSLFVLALDTGLRAAEIRTLQHCNLALVWRDGVIESGMLTVPKSKTEAGTGRTVPLTRRACATLTLWISRFSNVEPDTYVFPRYSVGFHGNGREPYLHLVDLNRPIGEWKKAWKDACAVAKVKYRWHDLRHTFITRVAENPAVSEQTIMALAGHVSRGMLARYSHIRTQAKQAAIAALEQGCEAADFAAGSSQKSPQSLDDAETLLS